MGYNIKRNWYSSFMLMVKSPVVFLPFIMIAFFEALAAEFIYFSARKPISILAGPVIRKFFGEMALHYPGNLMILPRIFYYAQIALYIFLGVFLTAISVNIFNNIKTGLPIKVNAMMKNAFKHYLSFMIYGIIIAALITVLRRVDIPIYTKATRLALKVVPKISPQIGYLGLTLFLFLTNIVMQALMILTVPLMVIEKKALFKSLFNSIYIGVKNFLTIFTLIFLPFVAYLPVTLLKGVSVPLADKTFPEMNLLVTFVSIIASIFIDSFIIISVSQFLLDRAKRIEAKPL